MAATTMTTNPDTVTCSVLLSLEDDNVSITSPKGGVVVLRLPLARRAPRALYAKIVDDDLIVDGQSCPVELTREEMRLLLDLSKTGTAPVASAPIAPVADMPATAPASPVEATKAPETAPAPLAKHDSGDQVKDTVQRMEVSGVFGRAVGTNAEEARVRSIQKVLAKIKDQPLYVINYYIPVELSTSQFATVNNPETGAMETVKVHDVRIPSPAKDFYRHGIRLDGSNWFMTESELESECVQSYFALFRQYGEFRGVAGKGARGWAVKQSKEESQKLVEWAMEELRCHLIQLHTSLIANIATAEDKFRETEKKWQEMLLAGGQVSDKETVAAWAKRNNRVRNELKDAAEALKNAVALAEKYDATECVEDLFSALRLAIRAQKIEFNALAERLGVKGSDVAV